MTQKTLNYQYKLKRTPTLMLQTVVYIEENTSAIYCFQ